MSSLPLGTPGPSSRTVHARCANDHTFLAQMDSDLGSTSFTPDECPECGSLELENDGDFEPDYELDYDGE